MVAHCSIFIGAIQIIY